jgi:hypothetical protein
MANYSNDTGALSRRKLLQRSAGLGAGAALSGLLPAASAGAVIQLGPEVPLGQVNEGPGKTSIPPNSVLSGLQLGKTAKEGPRWLNVGYRTIQGQYELKLGAENSLPTAAPPKNNGGGNPIHVPEGSIVSDLQLGSSALTVWYSKVESPSDFKLGPEVKGVGTKEPHDNGGGNKAGQDGYTITGFQWLKDPDGTLALNLWYRQVL